MKGCFCSTKSLKYRFHPQNIWYWVIYENVWTHREVCNFRNSQSDSSKIIENFWNKLHTVAVNKTSFESNSRFCPAIGLFESSLKRILHVYKTVLITLEDSDNINSEVEHLTASNQGQSELNFSPWKLLNWSSPRETQVNEVYHTRQSAEKFRQSQK